ncbi:hypothetical protein RND81_10G078700 [Saponaria officinalis]|uniref:Uncharacterized protein n=1 Tax=Saponaria officinalis TaxID=3572 RepID=A0AAW1I093_SAPOF
MQFDGMIVTFEINKTPSQSSLVHSLCAINVCTNHDLPKCRESPLPSKMLKVLQEYSPKKLKASKVKSKVWCDKMTSRKFLQVKKRRLELYHEGFKAKGTKSIDLSDPIHEN